MQELVRTNLNQHEVRGESESAVIDPWQNAYREGWSSKFCRLCKEVIERNIERD